MFTHLGTCQVMKAFVFVKVLGGYSKFVNYLAQHVFLLTISQRSERQMVLFSDLFAAGVVDDRYANQMHTLLRLELEPGKERGRIQGVCFAGADQLW